MARLSMFARMGVSSVLAAMAVMVSSCACAQGAQSLADAQSDPILKAMLVELDRNREHLRLENAAQPYFLEFRIDDVVEYDANSAYGALTGEGEIHNRVAHVRVRVGSYKLDNSHAQPENQLAILLQRYGIGGDGMIAVEVIDDDPIAIRTALWSAADTAYKLAVGDLAQKEAELKTVQAPPQADDFSQQKPVIDLEPVQQLSLDRESWKHNIVEGSGLFLADPAVKSFAAEIQTSEGSLKGRVRTQYLVNSEGSIVRKSSSEYHAEIAVTAQAADGMYLERSSPVSATSADGLGTAKHFQSAALRALTGLDALCKAPVVGGDEYHGPVLLAGNAAARSFETLFARAVEARVPALGSTARTTGAYAASYQTRVLPEFLSVVDDAGLTSLSGKELVGAYKVDDEGVPAQRIALVDRGKLMNYLMGREPIRDFPQSNGHGRAQSGQAPKPAVGVLKVDAADSMSDDDLIKKLIAMGKDQGLPYVYFVETLGGAGRPRALDRIKVADGSRELVRGGQLGDLDLRAFRGDIIAAGNQPYVYNILGDIPATVIAPPLLFDNLTVKRAEEKSTNLPYFPPPGM